MQILEKRIILFKSRYFYFNAEFVDKYNKKYFYFRIAKLFNINEKDLFLELLKPEKGEIIIYNSEYLIKILNKILKHFKNKNNIHIIFDGIRDVFFLKKILNIIDELVDKNWKREGKEIKHLNNFTISIFVAINISNLDFINSLKSITHNIYPLFPVENSSKQELPPNAYFDSLVLEKYDIELYKKSISYEISHLNDNSIDYLYFLIKIIQSEDSVGDNIKMSYIGNDYLNYFLPYLYISFRIEINSIIINKIRCRANFIREIIRNQFNSLKSKMITDDIFKVFKTK